MLSTSNNPTISNEQSSISESEQLFIRPDGTRSHRPHNPTGFSIDATKLCLTWPRWDTNTTTQLLLQNLLSLLRAYAPLYLCVAKERHKDDGIHYHAAVHLGRRFRSSHSRDFDIDGHHANIQSARNFSHWVTYCKKGGDFQEHGTFTCKEAKVRITEEEVKANALQMNKVDFLIYASINKITYAKDIWDAIHKDESITIKDGIISGTLSPNFSNMVKNITWDKNKCLVIVGESGIGKTTWAKTVAPKPCLFVSHIDDLKKFQNGYHNSIIFDDVTFTHYPVTAQIHLVDMENPRSIHVRYGTAKIGAGIQRIFTCNTDPIDRNHDAIRRRVQYLDCSNATLKFYSNLLNQ